MDKILALATLCPTPCQHDHGFMTKNPTTGFIDIGIGKDCVVDTISCHCTEG